MGEDYSLRRPIPRVSEFILSIVGHQGFYVEYSLPLQDFCSVTKQVAGLVSFITMNFYIFMFSSQASVVIYETL